MPIYEYKCESCSRVFEEFYKLAERPERIACPSCAGDAVLEEISFKGGLLNEMPAWLDHHVTDSLCDPCEAPITTRSEWKKALREKGAIPVE